MTFIYRIKLFLAQIDANIMKHKAHTLTHTNSNDFIFIQQICARLSQKREPSLFNSETVLDRDALTDQAKIVLGVVRM